MGAKKGKNNNGGRKAIPAALIDPKVTHMSYEELESRKEAESQLITESVDILQPPKGLSIQAKKEWNRMIGLYQQLPTQILCDLDLQILKSYCELVALYDEASKIIKKVRADCKKSGETFRLSMVAEEIRCQNKCTVEIRALTEQLCLSPLARARLGVIGVKNPTPKKDKLDELFDEA